MTDDQQRARELLAAEYTRLGWPSGWAKMALSGEIGDFEADPVFAAITAALRAAPEVPAARVTEPLRADEPRQEQADAAIYNRGWNDCRAAMLAARPQGVKDGMITRVLMLANRWDEVAKTAPSQSGLMNEMARELRAVLHDDRDSVGADNA